jgi:hypothetical protein
VTVSSSSNASVMAWVEPSGPVKAPSVVIDPVISDAGQPDAAAQGNVNWRDPRRQACPAGDHGYGMGLNARRAGLLVTKPAREIGTPPAEGQSTWARRRAAAEAAEKTTQ